MLDKKWKLGWRERGNGHGDTVIITDIGNDLVIDCFSIKKDLCEHIIKLHNDSLNKKKKTKGK